MKKINDTAPPGRAGLAELRRVEEAAAMLRGDPPKSSEASSSNERLALLVNALSSGDQGTASLASV